MGIALLVIGLIFLMFLAMKGVPIIVASLAAGVLILITSGMNIVEGISVSYMTGFSNYIMNYYMIFIFGAIFGKLCEISGATESIARSVVNRFGEKYVVLGIIIAAAILGFGGVSLFVALFALYPLAMSLFRRADIPRRLFPAAYIAGAGTFAMTAPFSPATQNIIPTTYLGTTLSAAAVPGMIGTALCAVLVCIYMQWRVKQVKNKGEHFVPITGEDIEITAEENLPNVIISLLPMIILIIVLNAFGLSVMTALFIGIVVAFIIYFKWLPHTFPEIWKHISSGAGNGITSIVNTAATVGFGSIVSATPAFATLAGIIAEKAVGGNGLLAAGIAVAALAGISGSASGGLGIAVPIVGEIFLPLGVNPEALHRVATVASSALDSLPHNGFVNTCLTYSKTNHKEAYFDIFVVSVVVTIIELAVVIALCNIMM